MHFLGVLWCVAVVMSLEGAAEVLLSTIIKKLHYFHIWACLAFYCCFSPVTL